MPETTPPPDPFDKDPIPTDPWGDSDLPSSGYDPLRGLGGELPGIDHDWQLTPDVSGGGVSELFGRLRYGFESLTTRGRVAAGAGVLALAAAAVILNPFSGSEAADQDESAEVIDEGDVSPVLGLPTETAPVEPTTSPTPEVQQHREIIFPEPIEVNIVFAPSEAEAIDGQLDGVHSPEFVDRTLACNAANLDINFGITDQEVLIGSQQETALNREEVQAAFLEIDQLESVEAGREYLVNLISGLDIPAYQFDAVLAAELADLRGAVVSVDDFIEDSLDALDSDDTQNRPANDVSVAEPHRINVQLIELDDQQSRPYVYIQNPDTLQPIDDLDFYRAFADVNQPIEDLDRYKTYARGIAEALQYIPAEMLSYVDHWDFHAYSALKGQIRDRETGELITIPARGQAGEEGHHIAVETLLTTFDTRVHLAETADAETVVHEVLHAFHKKLCEGYTDEELEQQYETMITLLDEQGINTFPSAYSTTNLAEFFAESNMYLLTGRFSEVYGDSEHSNIVKEMLIERMQRGLSNTDVLSLLKYQAHLYQETHLREPVYGAELYDQYGAAYEDMAFGRFGVDDDFEKVPIMTLNYPNGSSRDIYAYYADNGELTGYLDRLFSLQAEVGTRGIDNVDDMEAALQQFANEFATQNQGTTIEFRSGEAIVVSGNNFKYFKLDLFTSD